MHKVCTGSGSTKEDPFTRLVSDLTVLRTYESKDFARFSVFLILQINMKFISNSSCT